VDPDPVGSETFSRIRIWQKNYSGPEQLRIRNEFELIFIWKTSKICQFLNKNAQFKKINSFLSKKYGISLKAYILQPNKHTYKAGMQR
jgi:hypothetical protein